MALIASKISLHSCFASKNPNNPPTFLISKFLNMVAPSSHANTTNRALLSYVYSPVSSHFKHFDHKTSIETLHKLDIKKVKNILVSNLDVPFESLEMINAIQGLGIDLHFQHEIDQTLQIIYKECTQLYGSIALCFRLLRQEGHYVQESIFENILDKKGRFKYDPINDDVREEFNRIVYEASELGVEGEETLDGVKNFTFNRLNELCSGRESHQEREIMSSLVQPRHKTLRRITSKMFISMIKIAGLDDKEWLQSLLRVAEIDSIMLKSLIQEELSQTFKWWRELGLEKELRRQETSH